MIFSFPKNKYLYTFLSILALLAYSFFVFAAPPDSDYNPGEILNPDCGPTNSHCKVSVPITIENTSSLYSSGLGEVSSDAQNSIFLGVGAGDGTTGGNIGEGVVFLGYQAGQGASNADDSVFLGWEAGLGATGAHESNFLGSFAGGNASGAYESNFFGGTAGQNALNASSSNFFGPTAGSGAENADHSNFFGADAGRDALNAKESDFIGHFAGDGAANAAHSIFIGHDAGQNDAVDNVTIPGTSILIGDETLTGGFSNSIAIGARATNSAANQFMVGSSGSFISDFQIIGDGIGDPLAVLNDNQTWFGSGAGSNNGSTFNTVFIGPHAGDGASLSGTMSGGYSVFIGKNAGYQADQADASNFIGNNAGNGAARASDSEFIGQNAGDGASDAGESVFIGHFAGSTAAAAGLSNFIGANAGVSAGNADHSNFIGSNAGNGASNAANSVFLGNAAGSGAANAANSVFLGNAAGSGASSAAGSIFIGYRAGYQDNVDNVSSGSSILIGSNTSTNGWSNSIAIGAGAHTFLDHQLVIGSTSSGISQTIIQGATNTCTITTGIGIACSSDQRLKTNISDLPTDTLSMIDKIRTVTYNWIADPSGPQMIGFLAQDLQKYYPQLVTADSRGYLQVNYANLAPALVEADRELDLKLTNIQNFATATDTTFLQGLVNWLGSATNGITNIFTQKITTQQVCVADANGQTCLNRTQLDQLLSGNSNVQTPPVTPPDAGTPAPVDVPSTQTPDSGTPSIDTSSPSTPPSDGSVSPDPTVVNPPTPSPDSSSSGTDASSTVSTPAPTDSTPSSN